MNSMLNNYETRIRELELLIVDLSSKNLKLEKIIEKKDLGNIDFNKFLIDWFNIHKMKVRKITSNGYWLHLHNHILPYFINMRLSLCDVTSLHLSLYFKTKYEEGLSAQTIKHHFSTLRCAFNYAKKNNLITINPCDNVELPQIIAFKPDTLTFDEILHFSESIKYHPLYMPVLLGGILGLRRSEVVGLTWDCIDYDKHCIHIKNTYIEGYDNEEGKMFFEFAEQTKSKSSTRTLAIPYKLEQQLLNLKQLRTRAYEKNPKYNNKYLNFVCVTSTGNLITPNYITKYFGKKIKDFLDNSEIRHIRFHDLRHSCATFLHEEFGYDIKDIQIYLGHSDISTTGNIYTHINQSKIIQISKEINKRIL